MIDLTPQQAQIVLDILNEYLPDTSVWVFGSRIKGTAKTYSDLDLALITTQPLTLRQQSELEHAFTDSDLPFTVDLVDWASCSETFKQVILQRYEVLIP